MDVDDYKEVLLSVLREHSSAAILALEAIDEYLPAEATGVCFMVHLPQDAEGMFSVMAHVSGPNLHVINKAIEGSRELFGVRFVGQQVVPDVPMFDPFDQPFPVHDAIVETVMVWMREIWAIAGGFRQKVKVTVAGQDGYGSPSLITLPN